MGFSLPPEAHAHYDATNERDRLTRGSHRIEAERMKALFTRFLPPTPAVICDVGGGAGVHAFHLAALGYEVHLLDAVMSHVEQAQADARAASLKSIAQGDACALPFANNSADAVLLLGPLYHLIERADRLKALAQARRVLKPRGVLLAASCNRFTAALQGVFHDRNRYPAFRDMGYADAVAGQHRSPEGRAYFTTTFFHTPEELRREVEEGGFVQVGLIGIEGPAWLLPEFDAAWADERRRAEILKLAELTESEPSLLGASTHVLAVGWA